MIMMMRSGRIALPSKHVNVEPCFAQKFRTKI